jgi:hypothetical protein
MIPLLPTLNEQRNPYSNTKSPRINFIDKRWLGWTEGKESVSQFVYTALHVERYENILHTWQFGFERTDLYGMPLDYVSASLPRRIEEALSIDERITAVDSFEFSVKDRTIWVKFVVHTIYGDEDFEYEVTA